jgi:hypothetical protein
MKNGGIISGQRKGKASSSSKGKGRRHHIGQTIYYNKGFPPNSVSGCGKSSGLWLWRLLAYAQYVDDDDEDGGGEWKMEMEVIGRWNGKEWKVGGWVGKWQLKLTGKMWWNFLIPPIIGGLRH